jgi:hypothetical protein
MNSKDAGLYGIPGVPASLLGGDDDPRFGTPPSVPHGRAAYGAPAGPQFDGGDDDDDERPDPTMGDEEAAGDDIPPEAEWGAARAPPAARPRSPQYRPRADVARHDGWGMVRGGVSAPRMHYTTHNAVLHSLAMSLMANAASYMYYPVMRPPRGMRAGGRGRARRNYRWRRQG